MLNPSNPQPVPVAQIRARLLRVLQDRPVTVADASMLLSTAEGIIRDQLNALCMRGQVARGSFGRDWTGQPSIEYRLFTAPPQAPVTHVKRYSRAL